MIAKNGYLDWAGIFTVDWLLKNNKSSYRRNTELKASLNISWNGLVCYETYK